MQSFLRNIVIAFLTYIVFHGALYAEIKEAVLPLKFNTGNEIHGLPSCDIEIQGKKIPVILDTGASKYELALSRYALKNINVGRVFKVSATAKYLLQLMHPKTWRQFYHTA
ncbi:hypothetical protein NKV53_09385 [Legionella sp. 27cVA30]|uniref:hypothetical protein n=1 Tax=Legionella sp. 27cVA30 TaxID=2905657 RepID=UPI00209C9E15|nr:hypothetical protein [Legionella sp. 27cVA30]MCP0914551.1 hypothetical protein [Legionella sp. 27cVA30]